MKKTVSVIGCCATRNLFNYGSMAETWDVKCYAFQNLPWAMFEDGLNIPSEEIYKAENANFTNRMIDYDLNKKTLKEIKKANSEYLVVDLCTFFFKQYEITLNGNVVHASNAFSPDCFNNLKKVPFMKDISIKQLNDSDIDYSKKILGLEKFAEWIKKNYDLTKVIIYVPIYALKYINSEYDIVPFSNKLMDIHVSRNEKIIELSKKFHELLDGKCSLILSSSNKIARDDGLKDDPSGLHTTVIDNIRQGLEFNKAVGISNKFSLDEYVSFYIEKIKSDVSLVEKSEDNLLSFFNNLNFGDCIVLLSVSDEASIYSDLIPRSVLKIKAEYGYRQSYCCIIQDNEIVEMASDNSVHLDKVVCENNLSVFSFGFNSKEKVGSRFLINDKEVFTKNRGLNILVYDLKKKDISLYNCDLYSDKKAIVKAVKI